MEPENPNKLIAKPIEKKDQNVVDRLGPSSPMRTLKQILDVHSSQDSANRASLDPEHHLVKEFQKNLKEYLLQLHQETDAQLYDLNKAVSDEIKKNDVVWNQICSMQTDLVQDKEELEKLRNNRRKLSAKEKKTTDELKSVKMVHKSFSDVLKTEQSKELSFRKKLEDISLQIVQLRELQLKSYGDSATMKRAMKKTTKDREDMEIEKLRQDILITRLEADKHTLEDKISLYKSQITIKREELTDIRKVLSDAVRDIERIHFEKLQLVQQWNYSIALLEKRDQSAAQMRETLSHAEDDLRTLTMDITSHKKSVGKALKDNEKLTTQLLQKESNVVLEEKNIEECKKHQQNLEEQYIFFGQVKQTSEKDLALLINEKMKMEKDCEIKVKQLEKLLFFQKQVEDDYMKILHEKLTITKASKQNEKLIREIRKKIESTKANTILKEGEEAKIRLKLADVANHIEELEDSLSLVNKEFAEREKTIAVSEAEIVKGHHLIEKKQDLIVELNEKLSALINEAGGQELGPLERAVGNIKKDITTADDERKNLEEDWLRHQKEMVSFANQADIYYKEVDMLRKKEAVLEEKKIRIDAELNREDKEIKEVKRNIERIQNDMTRFTALLYRENISQNRLEHETEMLKGDFLNRLKEAKMEFVKKENEVNCLRKVHSILLKELNKAQSEVTVWEEKLKLAEETKKIFKSETHAEEIYNYKTEIRCLQFRLDQIAKEETSLIGLMSKAATTYYNLYIKAGNYALCGTKKKSQQYLTSKTERLKRKISEDKKNLKRMSIDIKIKKELLLKLKTEEEQDSASVAQFANQITCISQDIQNKERERQQGIISLSFKHKMNKFLQQMKEKKYMWAKRNDDQRDQEIQRIQQNLFTLQAITNQVIYSHPEMSNKLSKVVDHVTVGLEL